jgi:hypothetical protein
MKRILIFSCAVFFLGCLPNTVRADHYTISADDFKPGDGSSDMFLGVWGEYVRRDLETGWLFAPVHLPSGAVVKNMRVVYYDNDASNNMKVYFSFFNHFTVNPAVLNQIDIFQFSTAGADSAVRIAVDSTHQRKAADRLIRNNTCTYFVSVDFNAASDNLRLYSIQIEY